MSGRINDGTAPGKGSQSRRVGIRDPKAGAIAVMMRDVSTDRLGAPGRVRLINVLLPGAGLISQDRPGLGLLTGLAFWLPLAGAFYLAWISPGQVPVWGRPILGVMSRVERLFGGSGLLAPARRGGTAGGPLGTAYTQSFVLAATLAAVAIVAYLAGQGVLGRILSRRAEGVASYAARTTPMMQAAYAPMGAGDWIEAQLRLDELLAFDPEHFEANLTQARLLAIQGKDDQAIRTYARCRKLDSAGRWAWEIDRELSILQVQNSAPRGRIRGPIGQVRKPETRGWQDERDSTRHG